MLTGEGLDGQGRVRTAVRIGIVGPSCSGKSTVARLLAARLGARHLNLDRYYIRGHSKREIFAGDRLVRSFEHPDAYDGAALLRDALQATRPVVAEGFLLFAYPGLAETFGTLVYVDLPWDEIRRRRERRSGQNSKKAEASFALIGEGEWRIFGEPQRDVPGVVVLDGLESPDALTERVLASVAGRPLVEIHPAGEHRDPRRRSCPESRTP